MKKFLIQTILFCLIVSVLFLMVLFLADGHTDTFYHKFTTPKQESLIIGTSRAAQGLQPAVFDSINDIKSYNYAFTAMHSPYGPIYLKGIKKKIKKGETSGIFILGITPWSISSKLETPNDSTQFRELKGCLNDTGNVNRSPNLPYLYDNLKGQYYTILTNKWMSSMFLHEDGWLEISVNMDDAKVEERLSSKIKEYRESSLPFYKYSSLRLDYLKKTIEYLNEYGEVYLVRLPIHNEMMDIENELMPDFNSKIEKISHLTEGYLDMTISNGKYEYIDGNHLFKVSGKMVSEEIANWIQAKNN